MFGGDAAAAQAPLTDAEVDTWLAEIAAEPHAWVIEYQGRCIGNARLRVDQANAQQARYAVGILDESLLGHGLGTEVTDLVLSYAFGTLGLQRVDLRVLAYNQRAIRSYEKSGLQPHAVEAGAAEIDGVLHDDILMAIDAGRWRSLNGAR